MADSAPCADRDRHALVAASTDYNNRLGGWVGQLNGSAYSQGTDCVIARATVLVKRLD